MIPIGTKVVCINPDDGTRFGETFTITSGPTPASEFQKRNGPQFKQWYYVGDHGMWENHMRLATPLDEVLE